MADTVKRRKRVVKVAEPEVVAPAPAETSLDVMKAAVPEALKSITKIAKELKKLEDQKKIFQQKILEAMEEHGVKSFETPDIKFTYVAPTTRTTVDSKKLKEKYPEAAAECSKVSEVSSSVRISVK